MADLVELDSFSSFRDYVQIFTCKAHVFHIDPKTKRSWIAASAAAVNVSFFYDSLRGLYRIISMEGTKVTVAALFWRQDSFSNSLVKPLIFRLSSTQQSHQT